jgi:hypothetical protein
MANPRPDDPESPAGKPQGTLHDQEQTMEGEGQPVTTSPDAPPSADPSVDAAAIFEKLEDQAASERGNKA